MQTITSLRNPRVKSIRALRQRKYRQREGRFLIEGIRIVAEAQDNGAPIETLIYAPELLVSERAEALVAAADPGSRLALSGDAFRSLSDREEPQGIAAVVRIEARSLEALPRHDDMLVVVACQLRDPGNLGSILRTCDATGATGLVILEPSVDLYDPQAVRATMGSLFAVPTVHLSDPATLDRWYEQMRGAGMPLLVVASSAHGQQQHDRVDYRRPIVLLVGNERYGLPESVRASADVSVRLPMAGRATSLNVSAATAALLYEIVRQRGS
jgi:tRNA G18 (ribose-2'-O)-methylase SpoU